MKVTSQDLRETFSSYLNSDKGLTQFSIDFPAGVNTLDPLMLLDLVNGQNTIINRSVVVGKLIEGKKVEIYDGAEKAMGFTFNGEGQLSMLFTEKPYLLQVLIDTGYAIVLKKLTPPSPASSEEATETQK